MKIFKTNNNGSVFAHGQEEEKLGKRTNSILLGTVQRENFPTRDEK